MIAVVSTLALAEPLDTALRPHSADPIRAGDVVLRPPLGRTQVGLTDRASLWVTPFDPDIGGPRLGATLGGRAGDLSLALAPSLGLKTTLRRSSLRLESRAGLDLGRHRLTAQLGLDLRLLRQASFADDVGHHLDADRMQIDLLGIWDSRHARAELRLPLLDRGRALDWGSAALSWTHTTPRAHVGLGVGLLVGRPYDQYTLGRYQWWFWVPYPKVDLALRL